MWFVLLWLIHFTGIANTMDLPEKLLPRISSRMGIQRLCFGPYNYQQLQEIISSRLKGIDAFEKQAIEFASRKVYSLQLSWKFSSINSQTILFLVSNMMHESAWYLPKPLDIWHYLIVLLLCCRWLLFRGMLVVHLRFADVQQNLLIIVWRTYWNPVLLPKVNRLRFSFMSLEVFFFSLREL